MSQFAITDRYLGGLKLVELQPLPITKLTTQDLGHALIETEF